VSSRRGGGLGVRRGDTGGGQARPGSPDALRRAATDAEATASGFGSQVGGRPSISSSSCCRTLSSSMARRKRPRGGGHCGDVCSCVGEAVDIGRSMPRFGCLSTVPRTGCVRSMAMSLGITNCVPMLSTTVARRCMRIRLRTRGCSRIGSRSRLSADQVPFDRRPCRRCLAVTRTWSDSCAYSSTSWPWSKPTVTATAPSRSPKRRCRGAGGRDDECRGGSALRAARLAVPILTWLHPPGSTLRRRQPPGSMSRSVGGRARRAAQAASTVRVHLHVDTGMSVAAAPAGSGTLDRSRSGGQQARGSASWVSWGIFRWPTGPTPRRTRRRLLVSTRRSRRSGGGARSPLAHLAPRRGR
jgi:hypothetical protein